MFLSMVAVRLLLFRLKSADHLLMFLSMVAAWVGNHLLPEFVGFLNYFNVVEGWDRGEGREADANASHDLRGAVADDSAKEAGDECTQERQEDGGNEQHGPSPFIVLMSSTSMDRRLR